MCPLHFLPELLVILNDLKLAQLGLALFGVSDHTIAIILSVNLKCVAMVENANYFEAVLWVDLKAAFSAFCMSYSDKFHSVCPFVV